MAKDFELGFAIAAKVNSNFNSSFKTALNSVRDLERQVTRISAQQGSLQSAFNQGGVSI